MIIERILPGYPVQVISRDNQFPLGGSTSVKTLPFSISKIVSILVAVLFLSGFGLYGATVNSEYKIALENFNNGNTDLAIEMWQNLLKTRKTELSPVQKIALQQRLDFAIETKNREKAAIPPKNTMDHVVSEFDRACRMSESEANKADAASQFERVLRLLKKCYDDGLVTKEQAYYEAYSLVALDRLDEVPSLLDAAIENEPLKPEPLNLLAVYLEKVGNLDQKLITLRKSLAIAPDQPEIEYILVSSLIATKSRKKLREAAIVAVKAVNGNEEKARELAKLFPKSPYKETLERMATELAIESERTKMKAAMAAKGQSYTGPKLKVIAGSGSTPGTPAKGGDGSNNGGNGKSGNGSGSGTPAGGMPPPMPPN